MAQQILENQDDLIVMLRLARTKLADRVIGEQPRPIDLDVILAIDRLLSLFH